MCIRDRTYAVARTPPLETKPGEGSTVLKDARRCPLRAGSSPGWPGRRFAAASMPELWPFPNS
eukprot:7053016-Alexandrium_andersonii.AAC.1